MMYIIDTGRGGWCFKIAFFLIKQELPAILHKLGKPAARNLIQIVRDQVLILCIGPLCPDHTDLMVLFLLSVLPKKL